MKDTLVKGSLHKRFPVEKELERDHTVPEKIHFVWVGQKLSLKYSRHILEFKKVNPCYEVYVWTNMTLTTTLRAFFANNLINVRQLELDKLLTKDLVASERNIGAISDIIRYEVVYHEGGIYLDTDSVPVLPFSHIFRCGIFVTKIREK